MDLSTGGVSTIVIGHIKSVFSDGRSKNTNTPEETIKTIQSSSKNSMRNLSLNDIVNVPGDIPRL